jgi:pimeloyl-ACP methyl ester carboxylesterase
LFDCRGHGTTFTDNDNDLSLSTLVHDISNIIAENRKNATELILVGHSLGYSLY